MTSKNTIKNKKKLLIASFSEITKDPRVLRQISALTKEYQIVTLGYGRKPDLVVDHIEIPRNLRYLPLTIRGVYYLFTKQFKSAYFAIPAVTYSIKKIENQDFDIAILNDIHTLGILNKSNSKCVTIADMHEYSPEEMSDDWRFRILLRTFYYWICHNFLRKANLTFTVGQSLANLYKEQFSVNCAVILNACNFRNLQPSNLQSKNIRLVHSGLASKSRRLENLVEAVSEIADVTLDFYLVEAPRQKRYYRKLIKKINKTENVFLKSPVQINNLPETLNCYDVGIPYIYPSNPSLEFSLGNKIFDFIQARLAIVTGPNLEMANLVRNYDLGFVTESFSKSDLKMSIEKLKTSDIFRFKMSADKVAKILNAEMEAEKLRKLVDHALLKE